MNEPDAGRGEASHDVSLIMNPSTRLPMHRSSHYGLPHNAPFDHPKQPSKYPSHLRRSIERPSESPGCQFDCDSTQSHALQQLANTLRLQSLALKNHTSGTSSFLVHDSATELLEADDGEEDIENDPIFQKYQMQMSGRSQSAEDRDSPITPTRTPDSSDSANDFETGPDESTSHITTFPPTPFPSHPIITTDTMETDEVLQGPPRPRPVTSDHNGTFTSHKLHGAGAFRNHAGPLVFRRSAQAAALCPLVVHKAARMRKRTKSTTRSAPLPREGEKGKAVAAELGEKACSSR
jgi:hypothetical protein